MKELTFQEFDTYTLKPNEIYTLVYDISYPIKNQLTEIEQRIRNEAISNGFDVLSVSETDTQIFLKVKQAKQNTNLGIIPILVWAIVGAGLSGITLLLAYFGVKPAKVIVETTTTVFKMLPLIILGGLLFVITQTSKEARYWSVK